MSPYKSPRVLGFVPLIRGETPCQTCKLDPLRRTERAVITIGDGQLLRLIDLCRDHFLQAINEMSAEMEKL